MNDYPKHVIAFCNHKGGTGKTTSVLNMGAALGLAGFRVLLIDLDPQGFLSRIVGLETVYREREADTCSMLFNPSLRRGMLIPSRFRGFDVIPSYRLLNRKIRRLSRPIDNLWVRESLEFYEDYDFVLIDTAAAVTIFSTAAFTAATSVIIPVTPEVQPVKGAESAVETADIVRKALNPGLPHPLFLITQFDGRKRVHSENRKYLYQEFGVQVMKQIIRTSAELAYEYSSGTTVITQFPRSRGAQDYSNAADELVNSLGIEFPDLLPSTDTR